MTSVETVKIKHKHGDGGADSHFAIINKSDFDPKKHKLHGENDDTNLTEADEAIRKQREAERTYEANRGISGGPSLSGDGKNPSGTYSEPTPTDVRFPNKNETEFENNHGAFVGKAAAQMREEAGLPDAPGGLNPGSQVEIADDWKAGSAADRKKLAASISGADVKTAAEADGIIHAEIERRKAQTAE